MQMLHIMKVPTLGHIMYLTSITKPIPIQHSIQMIT